MSPIDILSISAENVMRGGRKTFLSIISIAVGIFSLCLISGLGNVASDQIQEKVSETGLGGITMYPAGSDKRLISNGIMETISKEVDGLKALSPFVYQGGTVITPQATKKTAFFGVNQDISCIFNMKMLYGDYFLPDQVAAKKPIAIVDQELAQEIYQRENIIGKELIFNIAGTKETFEVVGVIRSQKNGIESLTQMSFPSIIYVPYTTLNEITGNNCADKIAISCFATAEENRVAKDVAHFLTFESGTKYLYENINDYISELWEIVDIVKMFINAVAVIALVVGGLGIMNSMYYTIDSRRTDIGICMALGESRRNILSRFLTESVIICAAGGFLGVFATYISMYLLFKISGITISIPLSSLAVSLLLSLICGVVCGILPAGKASRLNPIDVILR